MRNNDSDEDTKTKNFFYLNNVGFKYMPLKKLPAKMYPGFGLSMLDRSVKEFFGMRCKDADLLALAEHFVRDGQITCVYCDSAEATRWDHLHPVSQGGDSSPGNLIPACGRCDDSKQDKTIEEWIKSKSKHRPAAGRLEIIHSRILAYQEQFAYSSMDFDKKLNKDQRAIYLRFREKLDALRDQMRQDGLIK
jgi:hypothetical protein